MGDVHAQRRVLVCRAGIGNGGRDRVFHHPVEGLRDAPAIAVRCRNEDRIGAVGVSGGAGLAGARVDRAADDAGRRVQCQSFRQALGGVGQRVAGVGVGETALDIDADVRLGILALLRGQRARENGDVVRARDGDRQRRGRGATFAVADRVLDAGRSLLAGRQILEFPVRVEIVAAVGPEREQAAIVAGHAVLRDHGQRIAIRVTVIGKHAIGGVHAQRRVLVCRPGVGNGYRVRIRNRPGEGVGGALTVSVRRRDDDGVGAVGIAGGTGLARAVVDHTADHTGDRIQDQPFRQALGGVGQRIAVDVVETGADVDARDLAGIEVRLVGQAADHDRRVIDRRHLDVERAGGRAAIIAVAHRIGDRWHRSVPVGLRREDIVAIAADGDRANAGDRGGVARFIGRSIDLERHHRQRIPVGIAVIGQHIA